MDVVDLQTPLMSGIADSHSQTSLSHKQAQRASNIGIGGGSSNFAAPSQVQYKAYTVSTDIALRLSGNAHKYQLKTLFLMSTVCMIAAFINMGFPYLFQNPDVMCYDAAADESTAKLCTATEACQRGIAFYFVAESELSGKSLTERFDLLCSEDSSEAMAGAMLLIGGCIGSIFYADITEKSGRMRVIKETAWVMVGSMIAATFSFNIIMFSVCLMFFGGAFRAFFNACIIYITETSSDTMRQLAPNLLSMGWAVGQIVIALLAMLNPDWQFFTLMYTAIPIVVLLTFSRFLVESPRYLVAKQRFDEAKRAILAISYANSRPLPENFKLQEELQSKSFKENLDRILNVGGSGGGGGGGESVGGIQMKVHSFKALFEFKSLRVRTVVVTYLWCTLSFAYFVSAFSIEHLAGDIHYNLMAMGVGELVAYLYSGYLSLRYPRKAIIKGVLLSAGLIHVGFIAIEFADETLKAVQLVSFALILTLRLAISSGNCLFNIYIAEMYPTTVRHYAFGYFGLVTKLVAIFAPPFVQFFEAISLSPFIPLSLFFFAGLPLLSKLRETFAKPLREQLEEEETAFLQTDLIPLIPIKHNNHLHSQLSHSKLPHL